VIAALVRAMSRPADPSDPDSVDPSLLAAVVPTVDRLSRLWYRLQVDGIDTVPEGGALLVGNHNSGTMFLEAMGTYARYYRTRGYHELLAGLGHDAVVDAPLLGRLLVRVGALRAGHETAAAAFAAGRKVVVFPGGNREAFRPWSRRYEIDMAGRYGFVKLAIRHQVPIVPVVFVGGQSGLMILTDGRRLAKLLRADRWLRSDVWPLMIALPWGVALGPLPHIPLPVRCHTRFLSAISVDGYGPEDADDLAVVAELHGEVVAAMQQAMDEMVAQRRAGGSQGERPQGGHSQNDPT
jgi:1-acyl-sn-glycerol-3-phosphate acyltransferase